MKASILSAAFSLALVPALFAATGESEVTVENIYGILPVTSSSTKTIVAVPWCKMSVDDNGDIEVSNVVKTAGLTVGDTLHAYNGTSFDSWKLAEGTGGVKYWQSVKQVSKDGETLETDSAADATVARGKAIMLMRQNPSANGGVFYLYGQVGTVASVTTTISQGTSESPVYNLVAAAGTNAVDVIASSVLSNPGANDSIWVGQCEYKYLDSAWKYYGYDTSTRGWSWVSQTAVTVPAGTGFTYVSRNTADTAPTFTWTVPAK